MGSNAFRTQYSYDADGNLQNLQRNDADGNLMHDLRYSYNSNNNQLLSLVNQGIEKERLAQNNPYGYDEIGQLTSDLGQGLNSIGWTVYNKVAAAEKTDGSTLSYRYNAGGNRVYKKHTAADDTEKVTHYIHDASGNTMAIYEDGEVEHYLYGSERIGSYKRAETPDLVRSLGTRSFDLKTQTNNVVAKVSDKKLTNGAGGFKTDVLFRSIWRASPYYPFGLQWGSSSGEQPQFTFQDQLQDRELGTIHYKYREADELTGRFWSVDPLFRKYPHNSQYAFSENRLVDAVELEGLESATLTVSGRVILPTKIGVTFSGNYGLLVGRSNKTASWDLYFVPFVGGSLGPAAGLGAAFGTEFGFFPTARIEDVSGFGGTVGGYMTLTGIYGGPTGSLNFDVTTSGDVGGSGSLPSWGYGFGGGGYFEGTYMHTLGEPININEFLENKVLQSEYAEKLNVSTDELNELLDTVMKEFNKSSEQYNSDIINALQNSEKYMMNKMLSKPDGVRQPEKTHKEIIEE